MTVEGSILVLDPGSSSIQVALVDISLLPEAANPASADPVRDRAHVESPPGSPEATTALEEFLRRHASEQLVAVGYRLVHGGHQIRHATRVDEGVIAAVRDVADLAPLHIPATLGLLREVRRWLPETTHVLCPDTAFHAGLPPAAATYALPAAWRQRYNLDRVGFHGLSYAWALRRTAYLLAREAADLHLVLAHLGGGASVTAVRDGTSVDTSMGLTPLDGVPMSTRSGAVDPGMLLWLLAGSRVTLDELAEGLNHQSGLLGLSGGRSGDTRELVAAAADGDQLARLALDVFIHRVRREVAAAATSLERIDALVFTGEIGWDQPEVRHDVCAGLFLLGVRRPVLGNRDDDGPVSAPGDAVPVLVVRTREEIQIAQDTIDALR